MALAMMAMGYLWVQQQHCNAFELPPVVSRPTWETWPDDLIQKGSHVLTFGFLKLQYPLFVTCIFHLKDKYGFSNFV